MKRKPHKQAETSYRYQQDPLLYSRGYDSPELFREDLWLLRIEHSRKTQTLLPRPTEARRVHSTQNAEHGGRAFRILTHYLNARCEN